MPGGNVVIGLLRVPHRAREDTHLTAPAAAGAAAGFDDQTVALGEIEQVRVLSLPDQRAP
jgi:hypothetical protein